jgi:ubiquinone/menaquinone biosynthesis C-methylase UbiE
MNVEHTSQKNVLHPKLAEYIFRFKSNKVLDYGCGDGRLLKLLNKNTDIDVYDINNEMLDLAKAKLGDRVDNYFKQVSQITSKTYDCVLLSMVLVCVDNEHEYLSILKNIKRVKTDIGKVLIAVTHPAFRDRDFSNFKTSYSKKYKFEYLDEGVPFEVFIEDEIPPKVAFTDYHWSLSFTINKIIESGLKIEEIKECMDDINHPKFNSNHSPFLIIVAS